MSVSRFAGRSGELRRLAEELRGAASGRARVVLVVGEAGVGKTRLVSQFAAASRTRVLVGRGAATSAAVPFSVFVEALETQLRPLAPSAVAELIGARARPLAAVLPSVAAAFASSQAQTSRAAIFEAFLDLFRALAVSGPLVLVLDDLHAADPSSWELVAYVARAAPPIPLLVVGVVRADALAGEAFLADAIDALRRDELASQIDVPPLERDDLTALATAALGAPRAAPELVAWLHERSRGNALYAVALLEDLVRDPSRREVPASVRDRVRTIARTLPPDVRPTLEAAAVLGGSFSAAAILALAPEGSAALDELVRRGLLAERAGDPAGYEFSHPLVQEAAYEDIGATRRRDVHRRAAALLRHEPIAVRAHHAARGAMPGDADAVALLREAAADASRTQAHREAVVHLQALLVLLAADDVERARTLDELAWHASEAGDHIAGEAALRELAALVEDDPVRRAATKIRLASFLASGSGDLAAAEREARAAVDLLRAARAQSELAGALNELGWISGQAGDVEAQVTAAREALTLAESLGAGATVLHALGSYGHALTLLGRTADGVVALERGRAMALARGERSQMAWHTAVLAEALAFEGKLRDATALIDAFDGPRDVILASHRALIAHYAGDVRRVIEGSRVARELHPRGVPAHSAWVLSLAALAFAAIGSDAESAELVAQAERVYRGRPIYWFSALHDWARGLAALERGESDEAVRSLSQAAAQLERLPAPAMAIRVLPDLADAQAAAGMRAGAQRTAMRVRAIAEDLRTPFASAAGAYASGVATSSTGALREATRAFDALGAPWLAARAAERVGGIGASTGRVTALTDAAQRYSAIGVTRDAERARATLRTLGPSGRRRAQHVGELTPREREIAHLAQDGLTARQIAERLSLSERTIETHLEHVYAKLGLEGRASLAAVDLGSR